MITISSVAVSPMPQQAPTAKAQPVTPAKPSNAVSPENAGVSVVVTQGGDGARAAGVYAPSAFPPVNPTDQAPKADVRNNAAAPEKVGLPAEAMAATSAAALAAKAARSEPAAVSAAATTDAEPSPAVQAQQQRNADTERAARAQREAQSRAEQQRFKGELPREFKSPEQEALDQQINELLPNMWKASRAAVDVLIGEDARAAAAARAKVLAPLPPLPSERALEATESYQRTVAEPPAQGTTLDRRV